MEVLLGATAMLKSKELRAVCVEVHFGLLSARGLRDGPAHAERLLKNAGFRLDCPDTSPLVGVRC